MKNLHLNGFLIYAIFWVFYSNPASSTGIIEFNLNQYTEVVVQITDLLGRMVKAQHLGKLQSGKYRQEIALANFDDGLYFISVYFNNEGVTRKIYVVK